MKKLILMALLAFASASSFAQICVPGPQIMGQPQRCYDGRIITPNYMSGYNPNMHGQQMMPIQGNPGWFQQGNNILRCSTASRVVGGVIGGLIGHYAGREITTHGHNLGGLGAVVGAGLGQQISCELMATVPTPPPQAYVPHVAQTLPAIQQTAGTQGTFCNIDGVVTHEVNSAACVAKAKAKAETLVSGQNVDMKQQSSQPTCAQGKTWTKLNWPGHPQHDGFVCLPDGDSHRY
jgi:hypothetical protein